MCLPRSIKLLKQGTAAAAVMWLLAGCGAMPGGKAPAESAEDPQTLIPPQALTLYEQAVSVMAAGDDIEAELRFAEFVLRYPDYPGAHVNLAILQRRGNNLEQAEASINNALAIAPDYTPALNQLGMVRREQGQFEAAEDAYLRAIAADPDYPLAHYNLAVLYELYLQRLEPALEHFQRYQALTGEDKQVERWIVDLERRIAANQRTANVTE